jgi:Phospholipase B
LFCAKQQASFDVEPKEPAMNLRYGISILVFVGTASSLLAQDPAPASVVRWDKGCRYPQAGWIVLHIEGSPYERGVQHGRLMAPEIAAYLRCFALTLNDKAPRENWRHVRTLVNALFLRKFDQEFLEEMKGIADGASAAGARFDGQAIDVVDIAALNCWCEIESLPAANAVTPTGLEGLRRADPMHARPMPAFERCSAFAATGPATADGKIVFGHVTMYDLYAANFANVWIDVKPAKGHRFVMSSFPGGIQSSMDYYMNDAGILISETTITQTRFKLDGQTCASRIRKTIQYADSIDKAVDLLSRDNNGLYTNEWLLADINTNEIASLELGTRSHKLRRSSKNEWFGDTPGFYWSCNSMKDVNVRLETIADAKGRPSKVVWRPNERDLAWQKLYEKHKGKIGADFAKEFSASDVLAGPTALDAKFTTTALAKEMKTWAAFGPPTGKTREPSKSEKKKYPDIKPLVKHEWTVLGATPPPLDAANRTAPVMKSAKEIAEPDTLWRGTLLPQTDGDLWLAIAFADYHEMLATEKARLAKGEKSKLNEALEECRKECKTADTPLADIKASTASDAWYRLASAKGVLLLHQLRSDIGAEIFDRAMDEFGVQHGGTRVTSGQFQKHMESHSRRSLDLFFKHWLHEQGLAK